MRNFREDKITKTSKINLYSKFTNYTITIPLQLEPNCKLKLNNGTYTLTVKGLDVETKEDIRIQGITDDLCEETTKTTEKIIKTTSKSEDFETLINPSKIPVTGDVIYESKSKGSSRLGIYILTIILIIITFARTLKHENNSKGNN